MSFFYKKNIQRICLKLTGESLMGEGNSLSYTAMSYIVSQVKTIMDAGKQVCIVVGGGNIYRGIQGAGSGIAQQNADYIGMLATVMNCLALNDVFTEKGLDSEIFSALPIANVVKGFNTNEAKSALNNGKIVLFCAGLGHPYFTTDTASVLRALEMNVDIVLKGTKVDGIYTADPLLVPDAKKLDIISYADVIHNRYNIMDMTAFSLCQERNLPIIIYNFFNPASLTSILEGNLVGTLVINDQQRDIINQGV